MRYLLNQRLGRTGHHWYRAEYFETVQAALDEARERVMSGEVGDFLIETGCSKIVMNDVDIAAYCAV